MILENQWQTTEVIYPFLYSSFGQCVAITQIIDFNVLDIVPVLLVCFAGDSLTGPGRRRLDDWRSGHLGVAVSGLDRPAAQNANRKLTERIGGTSTCWMPFFAWICALILAAAAAAAAAALFLVVPAVEGLSEASRAMGLRARCDSGSRLGGERERRSVSKRERAGRSVSSLSKRDRGRRSSDMLFNRVAVQELVGVWQLEDACMHVSLKIIRRWAAAVVRQDLG
jgi:hypothetical protein